MTGPFADLLVLDLSNILAGPSVGMFFAELGARVIKVESALGGGDATRGWKLPIEDPNDDVPAYFASVNWGKESIALDLREPSAREVVCDLARRADILIQSYKPGDEVKLGLDYDRMCAINPRLIYAQINAYGPDDPRPGLDAIVQAEAGFTYMNGQPDGPPTKMPVALIDILLAHQLKEAILLALLRRERTGEGARLSCSLLQAAVASLANQAANWLHAGHVSQRLGSEHPNIVPYGSVLRLADGRELIVAVGTDAQFADLADLLGAGEWKEDARFRTNAARVRHRAILMPELTERVAAAPIEAFIEGLRAAKIPFGFINDMRRAFDLPRAREMVLEAKRPGGRRASATRTIAFSGGDYSPREDLSPPPRFNEHEREILKGLLGYTEEKIARLREEGALPPERR